MTLNGSQIITAILIGLVLWVVKSFLHGYLETKMNVVQDKLAKTRSLIDEHIKECNEVSKNLILEKIQNLSDRINTHDEEIAKKIQFNHEYVKEMREEFKTENDFQRTRYHSLNNNLIQVISKLGQKLKQETGDGNESN